MKKVITIQYHIEDQYDEAELKRVLCANDLVACIVDMRDIIARKMKHEEDEATIASLTLARNILMDSITAHGIDLELLYS